jgi:uncharacterized protein YkwD
MPHLSPTRGTNHARRKPPPTSGASLTHSAAVLLASVLLATLLAAGVSVVEPDHARAAEGGYVSKCGGGTIFLDAKERRTFVLHNRIRRDHDLKPFCVHPFLQKAARAHSKDMIGRDYFSHQSMGGETFAERLERFGYTREGYAYYRAGENIAGGSGSYGEPGSTMRRWMRSDGHRRNILNLEFRQIGIGTCTGEYKGHDDYTMYTADFGARHH